MTKKILFCASTISHIKNFHLPYLQAFQECGYEVWVAVDSNEPLPYADHVFALPFDKNIFSYRNAKAIFMVRNLLHKQRFDIVSTHTTLASAVVRSAIIGLPRKPRVFCTVHGYLFNKDDGLKKLLLLIPEKVCASVTDILMVTNHDDYELAEKYRLYQKKLHHVDGMGINLLRFPPVLCDRRSELRKTSGYSDRDVLFLYAAEFSRRKNQSLLIRAFANASRQHPGMKLLLAGDGTLLENCKLLVRDLQAEDKIHFLGHVKEMKNLYPMIDAVASTSLSEGLPFNIMEAMACGLPVIASKIKGHVDLVSHEETGILFELADQTGLEQALIEIFDNKEKRKKLGQNGMNGIDRFGIDRVFPQIMEIYTENI